MDNKDLNHIGQLLNDEHSKAQKKKIASIISDKPQYMEELMGWFFSNNTRMCQRASWPLLDIQLHSPELLRPYLSKMVKHLDDKSIHDAVIRNTLRIFDEMDIPHNLEGPLFEKCCAYILNPGRAIAIRAFGITIAVKIASSYPELSEEMNLILDEISEYPLTPALKVRIRRGRKILQKSIKNKNL